MGQEYGICRVAIAPLRTEASDKAEISSQLLFGDHVEILEKKENWWLVCNAADSYEGWMDFKQLSMISLEQYVNNHSCDHVVPAELMGTVIDEAGTRYYLSPGSNLPMLENGFCTLGQQKYAVMFTPLKTTAFHTVEELIQHALFFLNAPYLWGGKNLFGIDCSGFVQIVFKLNGFQLKRDAWQQAEQGEVVDFLPAVKPGDVAFFDNADGRIIHVGIMLSTDRIIHASGKVRIDPIDDQGIYNAELGRYSHQLRIIKRFI